VAKQKHKRSADHDEVFTILHCPLEKFIVASRPKIRPNNTKPNKKIIGRENLAAVRPPILDKSGRKAAEKNIV
jgi:hypothetical protein